MQEARSKFSVEIEPENQVVINPVDGYLSPEGFASLHFRRSSPSASMGRINCKVWLLFAWSNFRSHLYPCKRPNLPNLPIFWTMSLIALVSPTYEHVFMAFTGWISISRLGRMLWVDQNWGQSGLYVLSYEHYKSIASFSYLEFLTLPKDHSY